MSLLGALRVCPAVRAFRARRSPPITCVRQGLVVLARNYRCRGGELDLVARDVDGTIVFVEVKERGSRSPRRGLRGGHRGQAPAPAARGLALRLTARPLRERRAASTWSRWNGRGTGLGSAGTGGFRRGRSGLRRGERETARLRRGQVRQQRAASRGFGWSGKRDSNPRLRPWQGRTLPLSYSRPRRTGHFIDPRAESVKARARFLIRRALPSYSVLLCRSHAGGVAKWLRRRSAKPLFAGSTPAAASNSSVVTRWVSSAGDTQARLPEGSAPPSPEQRRLSPFTLVAPFLQPSWARGGPGGLAKGELWCHD